MKRKKKRGPDILSSQEEDLPSPIMSRKRKKSIDTDEVPQESPGKVMKKKNKKIMGNISSPIVNTEQFAEEHHNLLESPKTKKKKLKNLGVSVIQKETASAELEDVTQTEESSKSQQEDSPLGKKKSKSQIDSPSKKKKSSLVGDTSLNDISMKAEIPESMDDNDNIEEEGKEFSVLVECKFNLSERTNLFLYCTSQQVTINAQLYTTVAHP